MPKPLDHNRGWDSTPSGWKPPSEDLQAFKNRLDERQWKPPGEMRLDVSSQPTRLLRPS